MLSLEQVRALESRVERAVAYIASIREENAELHRRLNESEERCAEALSSIDAAAEQLAAAEASSSAAAAEAAARVGRLEAALAESETRFRAAEARSADLASRMDAYRGDQTRIEEVIVHALQKLDAFEDLILSQTVPAPAAPTPSAETDARLPPAEAAPHCSPAEAALGEPELEELPAASRASDQPPDRPLENELDIF